MSKNIRTANTDQAYTWAVFYFAGQRSTVCAARTSFISITNLVIKWW